MKIHEFAEKYGFKKRQVDYYTAKGLLHPTQNQKNGYRDYDETCEKEVQGIIIAKMIGAKIDRENIEACEFMLRSSVTRNYIRAQVELHFDNVKHDYDRAQKVIAMWEA